MTMASSTTLTNLPPEVLTYLATFLDHNSRLSLYQSNKFIKHLLDYYGAFWRMLSEDKTFDKIPCLSLDEEVEEHYKIHVRFDDKHMPHWRKVFLRGIKMLQNISDANFERWTLKFRDSRNLLIEPEPVFKKRRLENESSRLLEETLSGLTPMGPVSLDADGRRLVVCISSEPETTAFFVYDLLKTPKLVAVHKLGKEVVTERFSLNDDHLVIMPSYPSLADAILLTYDLEKMAPAGRFRVASDFAMNLIDQKWDLTTFEILPDGTKAVVLYKDERWKFALLDLPSCQPLQMGPISVESFDRFCQCIRFFGTSILILFNRDQNHFDNAVLTLELAGGSTEVLTLRGTVVANDILDIAFVSAQEAIILKRGGDLVQFELTSGKEKVLVPAPYPLPPVEEGERPMVSRMCMVMVPESEDIILFQWSLTDTAKPFLARYSPSGELKFKTSMLVADVDWASVTFPPPASFIRPPLLWMAVSDKILVFNCNDGRLVSTLQMSGFGSNRTFLWKNVDTSQLIVYNGAPKEPFVVDVFKFW